MFQNTVHYRFYFSRQIENIFKKIPVFESTWFVKTPTAIKIIILAALGCNLCVHVVLISAMCVTIFRERPKLCKLLSQTCIGVWQ